MDVVNYFEKYYLGLLNLNGVRCDSRCDARCDVRCDARFDDVYWNHYATILVVPDFPLDWCPVVRTVNTQSERARADCPPRVLNCPFLSVLT